MKPLYKHKSSGDIFDDFGGVEQINGEKEKVILVIHKDRKATSQ
jgi:hypothetical protein